MDTLLAKVHSELGGEAVVKGRTAILLGQTLYEKNGPGFFLRGLSKS